MDAAPDKRHPCTESGPPFRPFALSVSGDGQIGCQLVHRLSRTVTSPAPRSIRPCVLSIPVSSFFLGRFLGFAQAVYKGESRQMALSFTSHMLWLSSLTPFPPHTTAPSALVPGLQWVWKCGNRPRASTSWAVERASRAKERDFAEEGGRGHAMRDRVNQRWFLAAMSPRGGKR